MAVNPQEDFVNVEINGVAVKARKGAMIIHVTDSLEHAYVPRFCYHEKLPIAANCRMCLVEVEKAPKPLPACATPVTEGMKVFTRSPNAIAAQKATMEFLLINHPLDCPICDQGGECELQDLAMGFGRDIARFTERKRVVKDKNLGPLVATDMTRCIHCTRCIRFGQDVAGIQELGTTDRGENMEVGTYIEQSVDHELSGNIIDLCPVGALTSKPFRYHGRAWEMTQHALVSPHDGVGANVFGHVLRGKLMRVVARANDAVNETWIADRDRFSYEGIYASDRLERPRVRDNGAWRDVSWEVALDTVAKGLRSAGGDVATLASSSATVEELYLLNRITRALGSGDIDHRLRQVDFRDADGDPRVPGLGMPIAAVEGLDGLLIVGSHLRAELPMLAHRVRKAARRNARVAFLNAQAYTHLFPVLATRVAAPEAWVAELAAVLAAALDGAPAPESVRERVAAAQPDESHRALAAALTAAAPGRRAIWLGALAHRHPAYADLRALAAALAQHTGATLGLLAEGGNVAGAALAGALPHRDVGGRPATPAGRPVPAMLAQPRRAVLLFGVEPESDGLSPASLSSLSASPFVVALTPYASEEILRFAHVVLPIGSFAETSGTYVNIAGLWQSQAGAARPVGEARPGWKLLRVLGNQLGLSGFDYQTSEDVRDELARLCEGVDPVAAARHVGGYRAAATAPAVAPVASLSEFRIYATDAVVRRAQPLQLTRDAQRSAPVATGEAARAPVGVGGHPA